MPKKKKRQRGRRPVTPGVDPNERRRQRLETRRQTQAEALAKRAAAERRRRLLLRTAYLALAIVVLWFFFLRGARPEEIAGHELELLSESGVNDHTTETVTYDTTPPVSGAHAAADADCGVHDSEIQNELLVHTLEHGAVGVLYAPSQVNEQTVRRIEAIVSDYPDRTFSAPYPEMPTPIAVVSWGELMRLDTLDERAVSEYIDTFRGNGPEGEPCPNEADSPYVFEATSTPPVESPPGRDS